jgi:hypothetical protein
MQLKEILGWIGVLFILVAYTLVTLEIIKPSDIAYSAMNLLGAVGIIVSSYKKRDFQPVLLNGVWIVVAIIGIVRSIF